MNVTRRICLGGVLGSLTLCGYALSDEKPKVKIQDAKEIIKKYVEELSVLYREHSGKEITQEEKVKMEKKILKDMENAGIYDFVE